MKLRYDAMSRLEKWWMADQLDHNMDAYFYEYYRDYDTQRFANEAIDYLRRLSLRGRVLSIGCGYGLLDLIMTLEDGSITSLIGLDVNTVKLAGMSRLAAALDVPRVQQVTANGFSLPFRDDSFDSILILATLSHVPAEDPVLREAKRVLSGGGHLGIVEDANGANPRRYLWCLRLRRDGQWQERPVNPFRVCATLRRFGFAHVSLHPYTCAEGMNGFRTRYYSGVERSGIIGTLFSVGFIINAERSRA